MRRLPCPIELEPLLDAVPVDTAEEGRPLPAEDQEATDGLDDELDEAEASSSGAEDEPSMLEDCFEELDRMLPAAEAAAPGDFPWASSTGEGFAELVPQLDSEILQPLGLEQASGREAEEAPTFAEAQALPQDLPADNPTSPTADGEGQARAPPSPLASEAASARDRAEVVVTVPQGKITFYHQGFFTARCMIPGHTGCVLTRSAMAGRRPAQGRPCGLLLSWLEFGEGLPTKADHWSKNLWPNQATRLEARERLATLPGGQDLLDRERPQEPGEALEPDQLA